MDSQRDNIIVFFVGFSGEPIGRCYRLRRCLTLARSLRENNWVCFVTPKELSPMIEATGETYVETDFGDLESVAKCLTELAPDITIFDVDETPKALVLLLRGLGSLIVSMDNHCDGEAVADVSINSHLPGIRADFFGLDYWVPDGPWLEDGSGEGSATEAQGGSDGEARGGKGIVFNIPGCPRHCEPAIESLFENLTTKGRPFVVFSQKGACSDVVPDSVFIREPRSAYQALQNAGLIVNVGLEGLFDLMSLARPVGCLALNEEQVELIGSLLPSGGIFDLGVLGKEDLETVTARIDLILNESQTLAHHASLSTSIVSHNNTEKVRDIISVIKILPWDTQFFGFPVAFLSCLKLNSAIVKFVFRFCEKHAIRLLEYQCDCHDRDSVLLAEKYGFNFADIRLNFERFIDDSLQPPPLPKGFEFDISLEADIPRLMEIADGLYLASRYYFDLNFPRDKVRLFYQDWVRKAVLGTFDDLAYVLREAGMPIGFCTVKYEPVSYARIRLVGLDPAYGGRKLGEVLVMRTLKALAEQGVRYVQVVTQGRNCDAQRLYQRAGFVTKKTELWYHRWFLEKEVFHC